MSCESTTQTWVGAGWWPRDLAGHKSAPPTPAVPLDSVDDGIHLRRRMFHAMRRWVFAGSLGAVVNNGAAVLIPVSIGAAVQAGLVERDLPRLILWLGIVVVVYLVRIFSTTLRLHTNVGAALAQHDLRMQLMDRQLDAEGSAGPGRLPGDLLSVMMTDTRAVSRAMVAITALPGNLVTLAGCLIVFWSIDWRLVALLAVLIPLLVLLSVYGVKPLRTQTRQERRAEAIASGVAADLVAGLRVIQGLSAAKRASQRFHQVSREGLRATFRTRKAKAIYTSVVNASVGMFTGIVTLVAAMLTLQDQIGIGELVTVVGLAQTLAAPLRALGVDTATMLAAAEASGDRVMQTKNAPPARSYGNCESAEKTPTRIRFDGVIARDITQALDLHIDDGTHVGVLGPDRVLVTLYDLVARHISPEQGTLSVDGITIGQWSPTAYRRRIIVAPHSAQLFDGSVRDNILLERLDDEYLAKALDVSASSGIVEMLPEGCDSLIGEGGRQLSGGQRQRIALARAVAHAGDMLFLIEPTSHVDSVTEDLIARRLTTARRGLTTVIATSSAPLLAKMDKVIVLGENGRLITIGPHEQLLHSAWYREALGR